MSNRTRRTLGREEDRATSFADVAELIAANRAASEQIAETGLLQVEEVIILVSTDLQLRNTILFAVWTCLLSKRARGEDPKVYISVHSYIDEKKRKPSVNTRNRASKRFYTFVRCHLCSSSQNRSSIHKKWSLS